MAPLACAGSSELPLIGDCPIRRFAILPTVLYVGGIPWPQFCALRVHRPSSLIGPLAAYLGYPRWRLDWLTLSFGVIPLTYYVCKVVLSCKRVIIGTSLSLELNLSLALLV